MPTTQWIAATVQSSSRRLFISAINADLTAQGLLLREGTLVDATLIAAPSSTKNEEKKREPEMHQTKKGNQGYFGMKAHIGAWQIAGKRGLIKAMAEGTEKEARKAVEKAKAAVRAFVEQPFHLVKNLFRHQKVRYRGLSKNGHQLYTLFGLANVVLGARARATA